jgi:tetratricopeptide (TPR) repeat protein
MFSISKIQAVGCLLVLCIPLALYPDVQARGDQAEPTPSDSISIPAASPEDTNAGIAAFRPCAFQQITPGASTYDQVLQQLGAPSEESEIDGLRSLVYLVEPFEKVEVLVHRDLVSSIVLRLRTPASPRQIAKELALENFDATPVVSETGQTLGRAYPERGLLLNFATDSADMKVTALALEPISAELFVLRAKNDARHRYQQNLADLEAALALDPSSVDALFHQSRVLAKTGQLNTALSAVEQALSLSSQDVRCLLQKAELLGKLERHDEALTAIKSIVDDQSHLPTCRARGECLWGDVLSQGPDRDFANAIEHHMNAIKLASSMSSNRALEVRREAKEILLNAFLGAAQDIALGNWQRRDETANKWLDGAREIADASVSRDGGDEDLKLRVLRTTLAVHAQMSSDTDPARWLASIERESKRLSELSGDGLFQRTLAFDQARALLDAASIEHAREGKLKAFDYATQATELLGPVANKELTGLDRYFVGRLYFFVGSSHAVIHHNHVEAARWYKKAMTYFDDPLPASVAGEIGRHGERLVSIGASYWETGEHAEGLELTRRGLELMKQASKQKLLSEDKLALPYGNLAAMYQTLGKSDEAKSFAELASRLGAAPLPSKKRR